MHKSSDDRTEKPAITPEEAEQFYKFFTTSVVDLPKDMTRGEEKKIPGGLFGRFFKKKEAAPAPDDGEPTGELTLPGVPDDTGELLLEPLEQELHLASGVPEQDKDLWPAPDDAPRAAADVPDTVRQALQEELSLSLEPDAPAAAPERPRQAEPEAPEHRPPAPKEDKAPAAPPEWLAELSRLLSDAPEAPAAAKEPPQKEPDLPPQPVAWPKEEERPRGEDAAGSQGPALDLSLPVSDRAPEPPEPEAPAPSREPDPDLSLSLSEDAPAPQEEQAPAPEAHKEVAPPPEPAGILSEEAQPVLAPVRQEPEPPAPPAAETPAETPAAPEKESAAAPPPSPPPAKKATRHKHRKPAPARKPTPEDNGLREFKELLDSMQEGKPAQSDSGKAAPVSPFIAELAKLSAPAEPPAPETTEKPAAPVAQPEAARPEALETPQPPAADEAVPEPPDVPEEPEAPEAPQQEDAPAHKPSRSRRWSQLFQLFGVGEDEAKPEPAAAPQPAPEAPPQAEPPAAPEAAAEEDTMSLPLLGLEEEPAAAEPAQEEPAGAPEAEAPAPEAEPPAEPAGEEPAEGPQSSEEIGQTLQHMSARLTLRCVLSGILTAALLGLGLMAENLLPATAALDPIAAPVAFMGANLLLLLLAVGVSFGAVREGLVGLFGRPSADSLPAIAAAAAVLQAVAALLNAETYRASGLTLMSGMAALLLFMDTLGTRIQLAAVRSNYDMISCGVEHRGAYRLRDRDLVRCLAEGLEEKDPWILVSRPMEWTSNFIEQSFSERTSELLARRMARILLAAGVLSGAALLLLGRGTASAASALATVICLGASLSVTLVAGLSSLQMQRTAGAVGAVIPGWAAVEELGGIDTVQVDARDLFTPECAQLEDIRIFKGGRIDRAILYAASILNEGCNTLSGLFRQIIADRTDILLPVKDLEKRRGLGFAAWCDNCRVLVGTREMMEQEGVPLPDAEYEDKHSHSGEFQILYLAVSGSLHAMFVLKYVGGRHAARGLSILQKENVRLLVTCDDPTLTAQRINDVYRLPEGLVQVLTEEQCQLLAPAVAYAQDASCCMVHLQGFASLTGGLRAAARAQAAEQAGSTVQLVSVCISVAIALLLTYAGSIGSLSLLAVLMYQAAWSALSLALAVLKQH